MSEVLDAGLAIWDRSTSKAFHVNSALIPMIHTRQSFDPRIFMSKCDDLVARRSVPGELDCC